MVEPSAQSNFEFFEPKLFKKWGPRVGVATVPHEARCASARLGLRSPGCKCQRVAQVTQSLPNSPNPPRSSGPNGEPTRFERKHQSRHGNRPLRVSVEPTDARSHLIDPTRRLFQAVQLARQRLAQFGAANQQLLLAQAHGFRTHEAVCWSGRRDRVLVRPC